jgi:DNA polymerase-3 subunit gamma/tau
LDTHTNAYRVLARKYRPQNFDQLIGQDALVRTLKNAIESGRIAHAYMLTGVRGVGKTTTARIIAKALNYRGPDGTSGPTAGPTDDCAICTAIAQDRHPDVMEMDAASRTGVDDIREILDGVRYAPTEARYKIYIIDEVHMLSKNAINALLKTLEEPPPHVKIIFATTEIRKVPVTVLSRCQRFDLRRVDIATLETHFKNICSQENVTAEDTALALIARAADGSVRDGLSILDQAIALAGNAISAQQVKDMLGLGDASRNFDILKSCLNGDITHALEATQDAFRAGADPLILLQDLLELTHVLTRARVAPDSELTAINPDLISDCRAFAAQLTMPQLGKSWQILLKGISEVQSAPNSHSAAEMILIRLAYAADLPDPSDLIKRFKSSAPQISSQPAQTPTNIPSGMSTNASLRSGGMASQRMPAGSAQAALSTHTELAHDLSTLTGIIAALENTNQMVLSSQVFHYVQLISLAPDHLEMALHPQGPAKLPAELGTALTALNGRRFIVSLSNAPAAPALAEKIQSERAEEFKKALQEPLIQDIVRIFPSARLVDIRSTTHQE